MSFAERHKFALQVIAFAGVMLPSIGLYYSAAAGVNALSWILLGLVAASMALAIWMS